MPSYVTPWLHDLVKSLNLSELQFLQLQSRDHFYLAWLLRGLNETMCGMLRGKSSRLVSKFGFAISLLKGIQQVTKPA